jgi:hypothetical protein
MNRRAALAVVAGALYGGISAGLLACACLSAGLPPLVAVAGSFGIGVLIGAVSGVVMWRA